MAWTIRFSDPAQKQLRKIGRSESRKIVSFFEDRVALLEDPRELATALQGAAFAGFWRFCIGDYRALTEIRESEILITVVKVGHRSDVYRERR